MENDSVLNDGHGKSDAAIIISMAWKVFLLRGEIEAFSYLTKNGFGPKVAGAVVARFKQEKTK